MIIYMRQTIELMAEAVETQEQQDELISLLEPGSKCKTESGVEYLKIIV